MGGHLNLNSPNSRHWDSTLSNIIKMNIACSNNVEFCVMFRVINTTSKILNYKLHKSLLLA